MQMSAGLLGLVLLRFHADAEGFSGRGWVQFLIQALIVGLFIFIAARIVLDRGGFLAAVVGAILGALVMGLITMLVGGTLGLVLALAALALVLALVFRTDWLKGAVIALVAWVLGILVRWVISML